MTSFHRFWMAVSSIIILTLVLPPISFSATIRVPFNQPTIQAGINAAVNFDTVLVANGTYVGTGNKNLNFGGKRIVVKSENGAEFCIIDCQNNGGGFILTSGENLNSVINGFTVKNGSSTHGGAVQVNLGCAASISNCFFESNRAIYGGAIFMDNNSNAVISDCKFFDNEAYNTGGDGGYGGAIDFRNSGFIFQLNRCLFVENTGVYGGAISINNMPGTINNCTIVGNLAANSGGAIWGAYQNNVISKSIIAYHTQNLPILCNINPPSLNCTNIFGNQGGNWVGCVASQSTQNGNLELDPLFCELSMDEYTLLPTSPCAPANNSCSALIGALPLCCSDSSDTDADGYTYCFDNCPSQYNPLQEDFDADRLGDSCDNCFDSDQDGFGNPEFTFNVCPPDNCPYASNVLQTDTDNDGYGDACDNCPFDYNPGQADFDSDNIGDVCDDCLFDTYNDIDNDGLCADDDNCPNFNNPGQGDSDFDGAGDPCDNCQGKPNPYQEDTDTDGKGDSCDNCILVANSSQADTDADGVGNVCDACPGYDDRLDSDEDGVADGCDICPGFSDHADFDGDALPDSCDNCPGLFNTTQLDTDNDGIGNVCDNCPIDSINDPDLDNFCGNVDNCPLEYNPAQLDDDTDGIGNECDNCPVLSNQNQVDADNDGIGDACCCNGDRGDVNSDGIDVNILDLNFLVNRIFRNSTVPGCPQEADVNSDGNSGNIIDLNFLVNRIFRGGNPPASCG